MVGLLNFLTDKVQIKQAIQADEERLVPIPFYPRFYGDDRFAQDFFLLYGSDCDGFKYAEGNYDPVPRGIIDLTSLTINSSALTNKFVRGTYNKEVAGQIQAYSSYLNVIPLSLVWDVEIITASVGESFKIVQQIIATFYKAATFSVDYNGFRVPCQIGFAQDYNIEKPITFSYGEDNNIFVKFTIEMEAYQPITDPKTEVFRGKTMYRGIGSVIEHVSGVSGSSGFDRVRLEVEASNGLNDLLESDQPPPDNKAPYGYDANGNPIKPTTSLNPDPPASLGFDPNSLDSGSVTS
jgi:hypothetical protein